MNESRAHFEPERQDRLAVILLILLFAKYPSLGRVCIGGMFLNSQYQGRYCIEISKKGVGLLLKVTMLIK